MFEKINERIKNIMSIVLEVSINEINNNSSNENIVSWDSLKHINLILALEEEFEIEFSEELIPGMVDFSSIKNAILSIKP